MAARPQEMPLLLLRLWMKMNNTIVGTSLGLPELSYTRATASPIIFEAAQFAANNAFDLGQKLYL